MTTIAAWYRTRAPVLKAMGVGALTWPVALWVLWLVWPQTAALATPAERLHYVLQLLAAPTVVIMVINFQCMRLFDNDGAEDPFAGKESMALRINGRVFQNTLEQAAIFFPLLVALALRIEPADTRVLPILVALWCAARLLFWIGYRVSIPWRSPGFDWTIATSLLALGWFIATLL